MRRILIRNDKCMMLVTWNELSHLQLLLIKRCFVGCVPGRERKGRLHIAVLDKFCFSKKNYLFVALENVGEL